MPNFVVEHEPFVRLGIFAAVLTGMAVWEALCPRRTRLFSRWARWPSNLAIAALNTAAVRVIFPFAAVGLAALAERRGWGLLNNLDIPDGAKAIVGFAVLDLVIYLQHVMFHAVPALWRLHRMHHADLDFDVTTGARFHPLEIVLSMALKLAAVAALGPPAIAVLIFEVLLNATAMFNHGNVALSPRLDRILRWLIVTPDMHRIHHSDIPDETNSNFGFNLSWWDRLLGTYRKDPSAGQTGMTIGLDIFRNAAQLRLDHMLAQPFIATGKRTDRRSLGDGDLACRAKR